MVPDKVPVETMQKPNYRLYDMTGSHVTKDIYAPTIEEAVEIGREWMMDGDWASEDGVIRIGVTLSACVRPIVTDDEGEDITDDQDGEDCSALYSDPEPDCKVGGGDEDDGGHDWRSPYSLLGGLRDNPGVWSRGGTCTESTRVCARCGCFRTETDLGVQRHETEPEMTVEYGERTEESEEWLVRVHDDDEWLPDWLCEYLGCPPTTRHTVESAGDYVLEHEDEDEHDIDELEHVFAALSGRRATAKERSEGLWSHCCQLA